jgi:RNA polymerase sigma-70 factor (ECF subfamily)
MLLEEKSARFDTTLWHVVLAAGDSTDSLPAQEALEQLCQSYWTPLYWFIRRKGYDPSEAEDLTQAFFERLLEKDYLGKANPQKGRFRTFLLTSLQHFLHDQWDRARAQKRGGKIITIPLDVLEEEQKNGLQTMDELSPEKVYDLQWAKTIFERAANHLQAESRRHGNARLCELLYQGEGGVPLPHSEIASRTGLTESAVKSAAHRIRQRYQELIRAEISQTVSTRSEIDEEIRYLFSLLSSK